MRSNPVHGLLRAGYVVLFASLACLVFRAGRHSDPPARDSTRLPATGAQPPAPSGFVCRSPHYTLTADIHAGS